VGVFEFLVVVNVVLVFLGDVAPIIVVEGKVLVFVIGFGDAAQRVIAVFALFGRLRGVWVQRLTEFAEQLAQGVALKIGLDMLAVAVLNQMSGGVDTLVGLA